MIPAPEKRANAKILRLFAAVDPSPEAALQLGQTITELRPMAPNAKWVHPEKLHLTLVFLGDTAESKLAQIHDILHATAHGHRPFELSLSGGGIFGPRKRARVLWGGVGGQLEALGALQNDLAERLKPLGFEPEQRTYTPHLTLARAGDPRGDERLAACAEKIGRRSFGQTTVRELVLYQSQLSEKGAAYTKLFVATLGGDRDIKTPMDS